MTPEGAPLPPPAGGKGVLQAQLEENLKKPKKQSAFMARLEEMQRAQEEMIKNQKKR